MWAVSRRRTHGLSIDILSLVGVNIGLATTRSHEAALMASGQIGLCHTDDVQVELNGDRLTFLQPEILFYR